VACARSAAALSRSLLAVWINSLSFWSFWISWWLYVYESNLPLWTLGFDSAISNVWLLFAQFLAFTPTCMWWIGCYCQHKVVLTAWCDLVMYHVVSEWYKCIRNCTNIWKQWSISQHSRGSGHMIILICWSLRWLQKIRRWESAISDKMYVCFVGGRYC